jgi:hypothetical protein
VGTVPASLVEETVTEEDLAVELARWLSEIEVRLRSDPADRAPVGAAARDLADDVPALRDQLERAAATFAAAMAAGPGSPVGDQGRAALPVVLSKRLLGLHGRCEGAAVAALAGAGEAPPDWPMLRGRALDRFVAHQIFRGAPDDPVGDLLAMLRAGDESETAEALERALDPSRREELAALAAAAGALGPCAGWAPRVEVSVGAELAGGEVRLPGRVDVLLGGPGTGLPATVVEVKSAGSGHTYAHAEELRHYALLCALRHGRPPAAMALWYADGTTVPLLVEGAATAAARRVLDVLAALGEVRGGRPPSLRPGGHCRWCPGAPRCPVAGSAPDARDGLAGEDQWAPGSGEDG